MAQKEAIADPARRGGGNIKGREGTGAFPILASSFHSEPPFHPSCPSYCLPYSNKSCMPSRWLAALSSTTGFIHCLFSSSNATQHGPPGLSHAHHRGCITNALGTRDRTPSHLCSHDRLTSVVVSVSPIGLAHTHTIGDDGENTPAIQS